MLALLSRLKNQTEFKIAVLLTVGCPSGGGRLDSGDEYEGGDGGDHVRAEGCVGKQISGPRTIYKSEGSEEHDAGALGTQGYAIILFSRVEDQGEHLLLSSNRLYAMKRHRDLQNNSHIFTLADLSMFIFPKKSLPIAQETVMHNPLFFFFCH